MKKTIFEILSEQGRMKSWLCEQLSISRPTLIRWNNKQTRPSNLYIDALCEKLDVFKEEIDLK